MALDGEEVGLQMELSLGPKRVKPAELTVMSRQLATMISLGHDAPARVLRARGAGRERRCCARRSARSARTSRPASTSPTRSSATRRSSTRSTSPWSAPARPAACSRSRSSAISDQLEKDDSLRRQVKSAMAYPTVVFTFAMLVLIGMIAFIVPVFVGVFEDFGGELPLDHEVHRRAVRTPSRASGTSCIAGAVGLFVGFRKWKSSSWGRPQWDALPPAHPVQDRQHRPEDRPRALVAHVLARSTAPACRSCRPSR